MNLDWPVDVMPKTGWGEGGEEGGQAVSGIRYTLQAGSSTTLTGRVKFYAWLMTM
jgi:hypothetical protein